MPDRHPTDGPDRDPRSPQAPELFDDEAAQVAPPPPPPPPAPPAGGEATDEEQWSDDGEEQWADGEWADGEEQWAEGEWDGAEGEWEAAEGGWDGTEQQGWAEGGWEDGEWVDAGDGDDGADYVPVAADRPTGRRWAVVLAGFFVVILLGVVAAGLWVRSQIDPGNPGEEVTLTIPSGATTSDIARLLEQKDIITNPTIFEWYLRFTGAEQFKAGDYEGLRVNSAMGDVVDVLERGPAPPKVVAVTFREGLWLSETRDLILETFPDMDPVALDEALAAVRTSIMPEDAESAEGVLFPATYDVPLAQATDPAALVDQMVKAFEYVTGATGLHEATSKLEGAAGRRDITPYEALIVASLVESEARTDGDRAKIARVIYNRIEQGMRLDIDASVLYALGDRSAELTQSQLSTSSPYNTRRVTGLPPTPINSPGEASIRAALAPAEGDWLFYVLADEQGNHEFTNTLAEHNRAVARAQDKGLL